MTHLTLSFFGIFQATANNKPLKKFRSVKSQGLLIYLALTREQTHAREALAALFWPDEPEAAARQNLRLSLYRLRQLLEDVDDAGTPYLFVTRTTVAFNEESDFRLDVADFLAALAHGELETAVSLYQGNGLPGDLLTGFTCDSLPFEAWLRTERERYHRLVLDALFKLTAQQLAQAAYQAAQTYAQQQLNLEPWREEAHRQLMQALALRGERSAAIAQYETCRAVLADELGVMPSAETQNLLTRIQNQTHTPAVSLAASRPSEQRLTIPFVGRKAEVPKLIKTCQQTVSNGLQVVTLSGNAGIGKTRLTEQFLNWASLQNIDVLQSRAFETSGTLSYQPLTQLMRQRLERENAPEDLLSDFWLSQLTRLLPELRDRYPDLPKPTQDAHTGREHLFEAITRLILALAARKPLLLAIDDWHWADTASRDALHYAALRWSREGAPIMLLLGLRQEAVAESPDVQQWLARLNHAVAVHPMRLEELTQRETAQMIELLLDAETDTAAELTRFSDWLFAESDGQPLFLTETLKSLVGEGLVQPTGEASHWRLDGEKFQQEQERKGKNSRFDRLSSGHMASSIQQIIKGWLVRISQPANKLLTAAAVLTQAATFDQLIKVADVAESDALTALDELLGKQLLLETTHDGLLEPAYTFSHQKVSAVVYLEAGAARRRIFHRRAFETLNAQGVSAADLVYHASHAGLRVETIQHSLIAGNEALDVLAAPIAVTHFETAFQTAAQQGWPEQISGADRQALYRGLGRAYELCEKAEQARDVYEQMIAYARQIGATSMECLGLNQLAGLYNMPLLDPEKAFSVLEQAWAVAEETNDRRRMAETAENLAYAYGNILDAENELKYAQQAFDLAHELQHPHLMALCASRLAYTYPSLREWELVERYAFEAQQRFEAIDDLMMANNVERLLGASQMLNGRAQEGLKTLKKAYDFIQQVENDWEQSDVARFLAMVYAELGEYGQAIHLITDAVNQVRRSKHPMETFALANYGMIYRSIFALDEAQEAWLTVVDVVANGGFYPFLDQPPAELCAIHALRGKWEEANRYAKEVLAFHEGGFLLPLGTTGWFEIEALLRAGDEALARAEVERLAKAVGNNRRYQLILHRCQAVLVQWAGDVAKAGTHLENALALAQEMELPGEAWPILGELGKLYAEQGEQDKAKLAYGGAGVIIRRLAETIDDERVREGFVTAVPIQSILENSNDY